MKVQVLRSDRDFLPLPALMEGRGEIRAVVWPGMQARYRSMHHVALEPGARTVWHDHGGAEAVYYVARGEGMVEDQHDGSVHPVRAGAFVLITAPSRYRIVAGPDRPLVCIGGPCPPDPALYAAAAPERSEAP